MDQTPDELIQQVRTDEQQELPENILPTTWQYPSADRAELSLRFAPARTA
jgi:hypothetical protein